ncbi:MAG: sporulation integral membrane protein YtvI [Clostridia bacterium]|nr:sporulation integral membrane protein YtvI [Clostridia bacterium]
MNELPPEVCRRKCFLINLTYFAAIVGIVLLVIRYALSALTPFLIAAMAAAALRPIVGYLNKHLHLPRKVTGAALTVLLFLLLAFLGLILFDRVIDAATAFLRAVPGLWSGTLMPALRGLFASFTEKLTQMNVEIDFSVDELLAPLGTGITTLSTKLLGMAGNAAFSLPSLLISVIICIVSTLFMLFDWEKITGFVYLQLSRRNSELAHKIAHQSGKTIRQFILSYGLILLITFTELSVGFLLIGFNNPFLLAALISIFDILPVVGCGGVLIPWMLISFIVGNTANGVGLLLLYMVVTIVRNATEPKIVGQQVGLHPLVTLMSMVVGSSLMGGVGLFGLPIALAVITKMNRDGVIHLFKTAPDKAGSSGMKTHKAKG